MSEVLTRRITYCGQPATIACDGLCEKAWGLQNRPRLYFARPDEDPDDYAWLTDAETPQAPADPGTYEGGEAKPTTREERLVSKWCARECERCVMTPAGSPDAVLKLRDFSKRRANKPGSQHKVEPATPRFPRPTRSG